MKVGEYLFRRLKAEGVEHVFGIPGDFALPLFSSLEEADLQIVVNTHEPATGFAADAYARLRGLGVAVVTFGAGALNMVNSIAQAYAERSPVLVVSGAPEIQGRRVDALLHHKVKTFESQLSVYREITGAAAAVNDPDSAAETIDQVLEVIAQTKRPGYLEIPRDVVVARVKHAPRSRPLAPAPDPAALQEGMAEVVGRLSRSARPVIYAGVEIQRFKLREKLIALVEKLNLPIATSIEGKAVFPEDHPNFVGIYMGRVGSEVARRFVEESDCLLMLGAFLTDVNTGLFTAKVDRGSVISASADDLSVGYHRYPDITLTECIEYLLQAEDLARREFVPPEQAESPSPPPSGKLWIAQIIDELNALIVPDPERYVVVSDVGDRLYASIDLRSDYFLGPGYYNSMGFGVPAAVAAQLASPDRRTIALVGDGGFQMTGQELSTAKRLGVNPIVIVCNNGGYAMMEAIAGHKPYFDLQAWDYVGFARALGGKGVQVESRHELRGAFQLAEAGAEFFLIEARLDPTDLSPGWQRIAAEIKSRIKAGSRDRGSGVRDQGAMSG